MAEQDALLDAGPEQVVRVRVHREGPNAGNAEREEVGDGLASGPAETDDRDRRGDR